MQNRLVNQPLQTRQKAGITLEPLVFPPPGGFVLEGDPTSGDGHSMAPSITRAIIKTVAVVGFTVLIGVVILAFFASTMTLC